jgi:broad specificity phosphatase PhoE
LVKGDQPYFTSAAERRPFLHLPDDEVPLFFPLAEKQALPVAKYLRDEYGPPDCIVTPTSIRNIQTCHLMLRVFTPEEKDRIELAVNKKLNERQRGDTYNFTLDEVKDRYPSLFDDQERLGDFLFRPPGGQSLYDKALQLYPFILSLRCHYGGEQVWVSTNYGTLRGHRFWLERWTKEQARNWPEGYGPDNCSLTIYEPEGNRLVLKAYNLVPWRNQPRPTGLLVPF